MTSNELERAKPEVEIELDGRPRKLKFDWWSLSLVDEECGGLGFLTPALSGERMSLNKLVVLVWAGLLHENPRMQGRSQVDRQAALRRVADWIFQSGRVDEVTAKTMEALARAFPAPQPEEAAPVSDDAKNEEPGTVSPG